MSNNSAANKSKTFGKKMGGGGGYNSLYSKALQVRAICGVSG